MRVFPIIAAIALIPIAGCAATPYEKGVERMNARIEERLRNAVGGTVGDFIAQTGTQPRDFYDHGSNRVFVFDGGVCRIRLTAERIAPGRSPNAWRVVNVDHAGRCEQIAAD